MLMIKVLSSVFLSEHQQVECCRGLTHHHPTCLMELLINKLTGLTIRLTVLIGS